MNAKASCCAFLKVRFMFALNRFVYSVENKSGNSEFFHRVFTVCVHTHPTPTNDTHSSNKQYSTHFLHFFDLIFYYLLDEPAYFDKLTI